MVGLYRATVVRIDDKGVWVDIPRLGGANSLFGPAEPIPDVDTAIGDGVLCDFREGSQQQLELIRKTAKPISYSGFFGPTFGETF